MCRQTKTTTPTNSALVGRAFPPTPWQVDAASTQPRSGPAPAADPDPAPLPPGVPTCAGRGWSVIWGRWGHKRRCSGPEGGGRGVDGAGSGSGSAGRWGSHTCTHSRPSPVAQAYQHKLRWQGAESLNVAKARYATYPPPPNHIMQIGPQFGEGQPGAGCILRRRRQTRGPTGADI